MISLFRMKNFKSWEDTGELIFAPLTGFFGTNSSGKSSIMQLLLMLKQTVESTDRKRVLHTGDERSLVDLGTYYDLIHSHKSNSNLEIMLSWKVLNLFYARNQKNEINGVLNLSSLTFDSIIKMESGSPIVDKFIYSFTREKRYRTESKLYEFGMKRIEPNKNDHYDLNTPGFKPRRNKGRPWPLPPPVKFYGFPDEVYGYYQNVGFLSNFVLELEGLFSRMYYLGPLREYPKPRYVWAGEYLGDVGKKGEFAIPALLASRSRGKVISSGKHKHKKTIEERIGFWLREMGLIHSFTLKPIAANRKEYELRVKKTQNSPEVLLTDVGTGVSQVLPVLVLCYLVPENSIILLEHPEIHLHPSAQSWLADILIEVVTQKNIQVIVESHSEHLLRRLQRRIAEEMISTDQTALYFCRMENSSSKIEKLDIDLLGNIRNWPQDFFGDEIGDLVCMTEAAMKRTQGGNQNT